VSRPRRWFIFAKKIFCEGITTIIKNLAFSGTMFLLSFFPLACFAQFKVVVDHVGYEVESPKIAVIVGSPHKQAPISFSLLNAATGRAAFTGKVKEAGRVGNWVGRRFWTADFSAWHQGGRYSLLVRGQSYSEKSCEFSIEKDLLERETLSNVIFYFKGQRASGDIDQADSHLAVPDQPATFVDLHGGWYDATGDYGIHLSHQNPTSYFNPQQVPLVAWVLLSSYRSLEVRRNDNFTEYERRLLDEGLFGADFLTRMHRHNGSFFESISAPGRQKLASDRTIGNPNWRTQIKKNTADTTAKVGGLSGTHAYEASYRAGGGMAIAALALASTMPQAGQLSRADYLSAAKDAFDFLEHHNEELLNDGKENILDDYCALMAATELYRATKEDVYLVAADRRANQLMKRLTSDPRLGDFWRADDGMRPYFHPSDAGLPVVSLLRYAELCGETDRNRVRSFVERSLKSELRTTREVNNPFGYARQIIRMGDGSVRAAFFFPHDTEAAPWWQGENARLASLASAARLAAPLFKNDPAFQSELAEYAWNQLHWILGRNPFDTSMLIGSGHGNEPYLFFESYKYTSAPGAIINGITAARNDEDGIAFNEGYAVTGQDEDWRWTEEWLPHAAWYLYAISLPSGNADTAQRAEYIH
jgi:Glycosyl hydrolase family 9/Cellulase N-terminal ig-like domain